MPERAHPVRIAHRRARQQELTPADARPSAGRGQVGGSERERRAHQPGAEPHEGGITLLEVLLSIGVTAGMGLDAAWWVRVLVGAATTLVLSVIVKLASSAGRGPLAAVPHGGLDARHRRPQERLGVAKAHETSAEEDEFAPTLDEPGERADERAHRRPAGAGDLRSCRCCRERALLSRVVLRRSPGGTCRRARSACRCRSGRRRAVGGACAGSPTSATNCAKPDGVVSASARAGPSSTLKACAMPRGFQTNSRAPATNSLSARRKRIRPSRT